MNTTYALAADALVAHIQLAEVPLPLATSFTDTGPADAPLVVVLGGISAHRHALDAGTTRGWWRTQVGRGLAIDTTRWRVVSLDWIGGPEAPLPLAAQTIIPGPDVQAQAVLAVLDRLQVAQAHAVVGASFGGGVALALAARAPERFTRVITLCAAARSSARTRAFRHLQREAMALGRAAGTPHAGVALARALALMTYRTADELEQRFSVAEDSELRPSEQTSRTELALWLGHHGESFARRFDSHAFEAISHGLDQPALTEAELVRLKLPLHAFAVREDELVPLSAIQRLTSLAPKSTLVVHSSLYGHDAFLKDTAPVATFLRDALNRNESAS